MKAILITILLMILAATPISTLLLYNFFVSKKLIGEVGFACLAFGIFQLLAIVEALRFIMEYAPQKQNPG